MSVGTVDYIAIFQTDIGWQCNIHIGPGHYGRGDTPSAALLGAAVAWDRYERISNASEETKTAERESRRR